MMGKKTYSDTLIKAITMLQYANNGVRKYKEADKDVRRMAALELAQMHLTKARDLLLIKLQKHVK